MPRTAWTEEDTITELMEEHLDEDLDSVEPLPHVEFEVGDNVVYPHHGAGKVIRKELKEILGEKREYLTIKILHNDMTVMVPTENAAVAGLRRVIDEETVKKVLAVLQDECSEMCIRDRPPGELDERLGARRAQTLAAAGGHDQRHGHASVSYTHLTLPTNREV